MNGKLNWQYAVLLVVLTYCCPFVDETAHAVLPCIDAAGDTEILPKDFKNEYCSHYRTNVLGLSGANATFRMSICAGGGHGPLLGGLTVTMLKYKSVDMKDEPTLQINRLNFKQQTVNFRTYTNADGSLTVRLLNQQGYQSSQLFRSGHKYKGQTMSFVDAEGNLFESAENASSGLVSHSPLESLGDPKEIKAIQDVMRQYSARLKVLSGITNWFKEPKLETPRQSAQVLEHEARKLFDQLKLSDPSDSAVVKRQELIKIINELTLLQAQATLERK